MKKVNSQFLKLYNVFREGNLHLTVDELYLYATLRRLLNFNEEVVVTVDLLDQYTRNVSNVTYHSRQKESRQRIKLVLLSLKEKGVIHYEGETGKSSQLLKINFVELEDSGHEQINYDVFDSFTDKTMFYIYFVVASWKKVNGGFDCSIARWSEILDVTPTTADKYVGRAVTDAIIFCNTGDYSSKLIRGGQKKRDVSKYSIYPFKEEDKTSAQKKKESQPPELDSEPNFNSKFEFDTGNWENDDNLDEYDYVIYIENKNNDDFIQVCDVKRNRLDSTGKYKKFTEKKLFKNAQDMLVEKERKDKVNKEKAAEQKMMNEIKNGQVIVGRSLADEPFVTREVYLDSFDQIQVDDVYYHVQEVDGHGDILDKFSIKSMLNGDCDNHDLDTVYRFSDSVMEELLYKLKETNFNYGKFEWYKFKEEIKVYREELMNQINKDIPDNMDWEGDLYRIEDNYNISKNRR